LQENLPNKISLTKFNSLLQHLGRD